jgi:TolA-binding protein
MKPGCDRTSGVVGAPACLRETRSPTASCLRLAARTALRLLPARSSLVSLRHAGAPTTRARSGSVGLAALVIAIVALATSCAYYNTYYLGRKYYFTATGGLPYSVERPAPIQAGNFQKSIDYSKKVIAIYPKSKWVDDAYLMWARSLLGKEDPLQTVAMLQDFSTRFPSSSLKNEATFYLGVAYRQARKYREALVPLDEFLENAPKDALAAYAHFERSRALTALDRQAEAAQAATRVIEGFPKSPLVVQARLARAEALLKSGDAAGARADFAALGLRAIDDEQRLAYLLREADCLESARDYAGEQTLLGNALAHEVKPVKGPGDIAPTGPGADRYGRLTLRIGTVHLLAGRHQEALAAYRNVIADYPKTALAAEAQYRIAYAYETVLDDFDVARQEYGKVRDQSATSAFFAQANTRLQSLDRLARFRSAGNDSLGRKVEAGFLLAEQYLFELDKPERALEAYAEIAREHAGTPSGAKALNAQAWVLRRKLDRPAQADSLLWAVVREYPATEAQLAARDYLEREGQQVPSELIKLPEPEVAPVDTVLQLTHPPEGTAPLGPPTLVPNPVMPGSAVRDSVAHGPYRATIGPLRPAAPGAAPASGAPKSPLIPAGGGSPLDDPPRPAPDSSATAPRDSGGVRP